MPIVSGRYKSPAWVNDQTPAIDASELNDLCGTVEDLDSEMGSAQDVITALQQDMSDAQEDIADAQTDIATLQNTAYIEKTVSGSIASFSDGAALPVKALIVQIVAQQSGEGAPSPTNIRPISGFTGASAYLYDADGNYQTDDSFAIIRQPQNQEASAGADDVSFSIVAKGTGVAYQWQVFNPNVGSWSNSGSSGNKAAKLNVGAITAARVTYRYRCLVSKGGITLTSAPAMMYYTGTPEPDVVVDYEPDYAPLVSVNWQTEAGAVYGGTLNATTGEPTVTHGHITLDGTETVTPPPVPPVGANVWLWTISGVLTNEGVRNGNIIADRLRGVNGNTTSSYCVRISAASDLALYMPTDTFHSAEDVSEWLVNNNVSIAYELASPTTYQLTPTEILSTLLGQNNIWANTGDISVTYRADPSLVIAALEARIAATQNIIAGVETAMVATKNYSIGDLLIVGDALYKVTAAIANGANITVGTNVAATTVAEQLLLLANA